jgi:D-xylose 1-dehydrogenase (NADP+, D-xylono-1,5-lactone-forming)
MSAPPLRWGLLGTARINRSLIPAIRASACSQLVGVASRSAERAAVYAGQWQIPKPYGSYEAMLADSQIDAVYIPLPNHLHVEWTLNAIAAGKHVLCEKPLALRPADVDRVAEGARQAGVAVAEAFMYRHHPLTLRVATMVSEGQVGRLRGVRGAFTFMLTRPSDVRLVPEWGGGSLWDVGCYPVSYARLLAGEPIAVSAQAVRQQTGIDMAVAGTLMFPDDVIGVFDCGFGAHFRTFIEISGTDGVLTLEAPFKPGVDASLRVVRGDDTQTIVVPGEPLYLGEVQDLERAVFEGGPTRVSLDDSRRNIATLVALHEAARTGRVVAMADIG